MLSLSRSTKILAAGLTGALLFGGVAAAVGGSRPTPASVPDAGALGDTATDPDVTEPTTEDPSAEDPEGDDAGDSDDSGAPAADAPECPADVKNHGQYVSSVAHARHEGDSAADVAAAAQSDCGKPVAGDESEPSADEAGDDTGDDAGAKPDKTATGATTHGQSAGHGKGH